MDGDAETKQVLLEGSDGQTQEREKPADSDDILRKSEPSSNITESQEYNSKEVKLHADNDSEPDLNTLSPVPHRQ